MNETALKLKMSSDSKDMMIQLPNGFYNLPAYFVDRTINEIQKINVAISESSGKYSLYQSQIDFVANLNDFEDESGIEIKPIK